MAGATAAISTTRTISVTDVVLRDGLQDEPVLVPVADRVAIAAALVEAGLRDIEAVSFVNPDRVPQMFGAEELVGALPARDRIRYQGLALNARGLDRAVAAGIADIALVTSASRGHGRANAGRTAEEAVAEAADVVARLALERPDVTIRGGISTAFVCPFDGDVAPERLVTVSRAFADIGITRLGLADTLGIAPPEQVVRSLDAVRTALPDVELSLHLHNAHGQALRTVDHAVGLGITRFDAAAGGYGGCPFAPGAHGNIATEDLVAHLHSRGTPTGIDEGALAQAVRTVQDALARATPLTRPVR